MIKQKRVKTVNRLEFLPDYCPEQPPEVLDREIREIINRHDRTVAWTSKQQSTFAIARQMLVGLCYPGVKIM